MMLKEKEGMNMKQQTLIQKHNRQFLGDEKIISCHWLKEIEDDSGVSASSFWFNGEKLINFSSTLATEAEFASGSFS